MHFESLKLPNLLIQSLHKNKLDNPTPVQAQAIPSALKNKDLFVCAKTGSGKTAAFLIPILTKHILTQNQSYQGVGSLILCPTRELAIQIHKVVRRLSQDIPIQTELIIGGDSYQKQYTQLQKPIHLLIATPGRLLRHLTQGHIRLNNIHTVVLDEADRILDMGFIDSVYQILRYTPEHRQTCLFSATMDKKIQDFAAPIQNNPQYIEIDTPQTKHSQIIQGYISIPKHLTRQECLLIVLRQLNYTQCIIFCATKKQTEEVSDYLNIEGILSIALHGDMPQKDRRDMMKLYRSKQINVLVATDLLARGIDQKSISHVIHFNLPESPEDYVHRIGRTARGSQTGYAICLIDESKDLAHLQKIEQFLEYTIPPFK